MYWPAEENEFENAELVENQLRLGDKPAHREGIFRSAMRQNVFGQQIPLDLLNGDHHIWGEPTELR
ncbi:MAG: hypothetical protein CMO26_12190 [Thiotrichales bacterium]|nr:hypothetical protein [Thiotrichales bacterium]|tara:strand:+ start:259 stop:456 length:198 start_codon:yes stop_codon:yes gene_type:complete